MAKDDASVDSCTKVLVPLHDLATDCLRLSMHFFHPIQQCAQQVYCTAVPLSPTSSLLGKSYLQHILDNHLSHVTAFVGAPHTWGSLLRTIDTRPKQLTCMTTSSQRIITASGDNLDIYDVVTGVLQQSLSAPETVIKIEGSLDGSILFLAHSSSVTMWDVQTGGLVHTFTTQSSINDMTVSTAHIACGLSDGSVVLWDIHAREEGKGFGNGQPVITICWLSPQVLAVATQGTLYIHNIIDGKSSVWFSAPGHIWGMVQFGGDLLLGASWQIPGVGREQCFFKPINYTQEWQPHPQGESSVHSGKLEGATVVGEEIACITSGTGVQLFNPRSHCWTKSPPLLGAARSVSMSLGRNVVVQNNDSIQIFSIDVLTSGKVHEDIRPSFVYPLGEKYIICIQPDKCVTLLEWETLKGVCPDSNTPLWSLLTNLSPFGHTSPLTKSPFAHASLNHGLVAKFSISSLMQAWQLGTPLPSSAEVTDEDGLLSGLSPDCTFAVTIYSSPQPELHLEDAKHGTTLVSLPLGYEDLGVGKIYDLIFNSEARFYLKIDGPGLHVQVPHDIHPLTSGCNSYTITRGEPVHLPEPRAIPPYTLDANSEWVVDVESRKICWIPSGNVRRGGGGHFWAGSSLVMVGDDGVVRKLSFKEPDSVQLFERLQRFVR